MTRAREHRAKSAGRGRALAAAHALAVVLGGLGAIALPPSAALAGELAANSTAKPWQIKGALAALDDPDDAVGRGALARLVEWGAAAEIPKERWERAVKWAADPAPSASRPACIALAAMAGAGKGDARPILIGRLGVELDERGDPALDGFAALSASDKRSAVPLLIARFKDTSRSVPARSAAILALSAIGKDAAPAVPELLDTLRDARPPIHYAAILAFAAIGEGAAPALPWLRSTLSEARSGHWYRNALPSDGPLTGRPPCPWDGRGAGSCFLYASAAAIMNIDARVEGEVAAFQKGSAGLSSELRGFGDAAARELIVGPSGDLRELVMALAAKDREERANAADLLTRMGARADRGAQHLTGLLTNKDADVRAAARHILDNVAGDRAVSAAAATEDQPTLALKKRLELGEATLDEAIEMLGGDEKASRAASAALIDRGPLPIEQTATLIAAARKNPERRAAIALVAYITGGGAPEVERLVRRLDDDEPRASEQGASAGDHSAWIPYGAGAGIAAAGLLAGLAIRKRRARPKP